MEDTEQPVEPLAPLSAAQLRALKAICWYQKKYGLSPLQRELSKMLGMESPQGCKTLLKALKKKRYITIEPNKHRSLRVLVPPAEAARRLVAIPGL